MWEGGAAQEDDTAEAQAHVYVAVLHRDHSLAS